MKTFRAKKAKVCTTWPTWNNRNTRNLPKSFTVVIQPLSTRLIKPNFCFHLSHRRSTTVPLETRNPFTRNLRQSCILKCRFRCSSRRSFLNSLTSQITQFRFHLNSLSTCNCTSALHYTATLQEIN